MKAKKFDLQEPQRKMPLHLRPSPENQTQVLEQGITSPASLAIGGLSIVVFLGFILFVNEQADLLRISTFAFYLSWVVNWPHFMSSYLLLYRDRRSELFKKPKLFWAAFIVPAVLFAIMSYAFNTASHFWLSALVQVLYLTVGWHYVKQIFGTIVVTSAQEKYYLKPSERWTLLIHLFSIWGLSFVSAQRNTGQAEFYGVKYGFLELAYEWQIAAYVITALTGLVALTVLIRRYLQEGRTLAWPGLVSLAALYCWYLPFAYHRHFFYLVPFFHSFQYLYFVYVLKKNQWQSEANKKSTEPKAQRVYQFKKVLGFSLFTFASGMLFFKLIPTWLDENYLTQSSFAVIALGPTAFMAAFQMFINIHHYFIDNVIWRGENPNLKQNLFGPQ